MITAAAKKKKKRIEKMSSKCPQNSEKGRENWKNESWPEASNPCRMGTLRNSAEFG